MSDKDQAEASDTNSLDGKLEAAFDEIEKQAVPSAPKSGSSLTGLMAMLLALIAIGMTSYVIYQQIYKNPYSSELAANTEALNRQLDAKVGALRTQLQANTSQVNQLQSEYQAATNQSDQVKSQLQSFMTQIQEKLGTSSQDWLLAEVEYLVRLANQRILMEADGPGAIALLSSADELLLQGQNLTAFDLRQAISADIAALKAVQPVDVEGAYLRLAALMGQIGTLRQKDLRYVAPESERAAAVPDATGFLGTLQSAMSSLSSRLGQLVDYRRGDIKVTPVLPPTEEYFLRQNLRLTLQQAQLALLRRHQGVYDAAVLEAERWITDYFEPEDSATQALIEELRTLQQLRVSVALPAPAASLKVVRQYLAGFHQAGNKVQEADQP